MRKNKFHGPVIWEIFVVSIIKKNAISIAHLRFIRQVLVLLLLGSRKLREGD